MTTMTVSKLDRLAMAFSNGAQLTARQIASRFRVSNPYDMVYKLRNEGFQIELDARTNSKGETLQFYSIARKASRKSRAV